MTKFSDLPGWSFHTDEVSAGVYEVVARDQDGNTVSEKGFDPDSVLRICRAKASEIEHSKK